MPARRGERRRATPAGDEGEGVSTAGMDSGDRSELVNELLAALEKKGAPDALQLLDLMRVERELGDALRVVRGLIESIVGGQLGP